MGGYPPRGGFPAGTPLLSNATDEEQLAFACREGRVLITCDDDFATLHYQGAEHAGIVLWLSEKHFGTVVRAIDALASGRDATSFRGRVIYV